MALPLRTSLLLVVAVTSMTPIAAVAWYETSSASERDAAAEDALRENVALATAARMEAAAAADDDPWAAAGGEAVLLVARDGSWRAADGSSGRDARLAAHLAALSGTTSGADPRTGEAAHLAWARVPALDAAVVVASAPPAPFPVAQALVGVAIPLAAGALVVAIALTRRVVAPIQRLERATHALAEGDARPVPETGGAEVASLARTFNAMAARIEEQRRALEAYAVETREDVDAVSFALAHELREPLRSMRTLASAVEEDADAEDALKTLRLLRERITHLENVVLDLMRYDALARAAFVPARVDLGALVDEVAGEVHVTVEREALPAAVADERLVREAVAQVLQNAAQHGAGPVHVSGRVADGKAVLDFDDAGPGVPAARREDAFQLFQRLRPDSPGTGIGLALVRRIAALHGGDARLDEAPGGGARVEMTLALEGPPARPAVAPGAARAF